MDYMQKSVTRSKCLVYVSRVHHYVIEYVNATKMQVLLSWFVTKTGEVLSHVVNISKNIMEVYSLLPNKLFTASLSPTVIYHHTRLLHVSQLAEYYFLASWMQFVSLATISIQQGSEWLLKNVESRMQKIQRCRFCRESLLWPKWPHTVHNLAYCFIWNPSHSHK